MHHKLKLLCRPLVSIAILFLMSPVQAGSLVTGNPSLGFVRQTIHSIQVAFGNGVPVVFIAGNQSPNSFCRILFTDPAERLQIFPLAQLVNQAKNAARGEILCQKNGLTSNLEVELEFGPEIDNFLSIIIQ